MTLSNKKKLATWFNLEAFGDSKGMCTAPFNHLVVDNALTSKALKSLRAVAKGIKKENRVWHGSGRYRFALCPDKSFTSLLNSSEFMSFLKEFTQVKIRDRKPKKSVPSFYFFEPGTERLPMHNDYYETLTYEFTILLYIHKTWNKSNGGRLCLHDQKQHYDIVKRVAPIPNRLVIFEPTKKSFHSVEAAKGNWTRLLLNIQIYGKSHKKRINLV